MASELRLHLDECASLAPAVAAELRRRGVDVTTSQQLRLLAASDGAQFAFAIREGRVLVTQDDDFLDQTRFPPPHPGIVYYSPTSLSVGNLIDQLWLIASVMTPGEMRSRVEFLKGR